MTWLRSSVTALVATSAIALVAQPGAAQEMRGRITGVISDNTGAVLPGVTVTIAGPALIQPQSTTTSEEGIYRYPALPPGVYTLTFELSGFQTLRHEGIPTDKIHIIPLAYQSSAAAESFVRSYPREFSSKRPLRVLFLGQIDLRKGAKT